MNEHEKSPKVETFLTIRETCDFLRISRSTAARLLRRGGSDGRNSPAPFNSAIRLGRKILIPLSAINSLAPQKRANLGGQHE